MSFGHKNLRFLSSGRESFFFLYYFEDREQGGTFNLLWRSSPILSTIGSKTCSQGRVSLLKVGWVTISKLGWVLFIYFDCAWPFPRTWWLYINLQRSKTCLLRTHDNNNNVWGIIIGNISSPLCLDECKSSVQVLLEWGWFEGKKYYC